MAFLDYIIPRGFGRKKSIFIDDEGRPKTVIVTGQAKGKNIPAPSPGRDEQTLKQYWNYYTTDGTIFASVNITAWNSVMVGYNLLSDNPKAKEIIQRKLEQMDLDGILLDNVVYTLIFGDSFIEKVRSKKKPEDIKKASKVLQDKKKPSGFLVRLKSVNPITMTINADEYGTITGYTQTIEGKKLETKILPEDILHNRFFPRPDSPYGISLIEPSRITIDRKLDTDETIYQAIKRHTPKYVVTLGEKDDIPGKAVFDKIKSELEDISAKNEFIVPGTVSIATIDERGVPNVEQYFSTFQTQMIIGLLCPEEALGLGTGSTEATSKVKEIMYERFIKAIQHKLATRIRLEVINPILLENGMDEDIVFMRFNSVTDADEAVKAKWMGNLLRGFQFSDKPFTVNEIRAVFDFPPIEGGDELIKASKPEGQQTSGDGNDVKDKEVEEDKNEGDENNEEDEE